MKTLYLVRHGETESNRKGIFRGRLDIPLSQRGIAQAGDLKGYFKNIPVDMVFTSPLRRAVETAEIVFQGAEIKKTELLNNLDLGAWSGREKEKLRQQSPEKWKEWVETPEKIRFPGGERLRDVYRRAEKFLKMIKGVDAQSIAAVSHRSVVKIIVAAGLGIKENYFWKFHLDNCSVSRLFFEKKRGFTLSRLNDTHFLEETVQEWY